jgi:hypothetical protein
MVIHIIAVFLAFITGFISFIADVVFHIENIANLVFLISSVFSSCVSALECYIFIQISNELTRNQEMLINDYGRIRPKPIRYS